MIVLHREVRFGNLQLFTLHLPFWPFPFWGSAHLVFSPRVLQSHVSFVPLSPSCFLCSISSPQYRSSYVLIVYSLSYSLFPFLHVPLCAWHDLFSLRCLWDPSSLSNASCQTTNLLCTYSSVCPWVLTIPIFLLLTCACHRSSQSCFSHHPSRHSHLCSF